MIWLVFDVTARVTINDEKTLIMDRIFAKLFKLMAVRWLLLVITIQMVSSRPMEDSKYVVESAPIFDDEVSVNCYQYILMGKRLNILIHESILMEDITI